MGPKLLGVFKMEYPIVRRLSETLHEKISYVGFDTDGQAWGLVEEALRVEPPGELASGVKHAGAWRLNFQRWVRFNAIRTVPDEIVEEGAGAWKRGEGRRAAHEGA